MRTHLVIVWIALNGGIGGLTWMIKEKETIIFWLNIAASIIMAGNIAFKIICSFCFYTVLRK